MNILKEVINNTGEYSWSSKTLNETIYKPRAASQEVFDKFEKKDNKKIAAASVIGSLAGICAAVGGVYAIAKRKNPAASIMNLRYEEPDILLVGAGSILGGLAGGVFADKNQKNHKAKLREASQQFFGNILCPVGLLSVSSKLLEKSGFKLPKINSSSKPVQILNVILGAAPKIAVTVASLVCGMEAGNAIMNKVNNKIFKEREKHEVKAEDYLLHADDLCLAANLLLKDTKSISNITSKILPFTFVIAGSKTGMKQANNKMSEQISTISRRCE